MDWRSAMSKASEWAKRHEEYVAQNQPQRSIDDELLAHVDEYGCMEIDRRGHTWNSDDALALARWILDTFEDKKG